MSDRIDAARRAVRKVLRDARDKNKWRKIVKIRLWMPVVLQLVLIAAVASYTSSRFPGFLSASNLSSILILAVPLAIVAIAQTNALLVGYLDLSVGAMVTLGVVVASFLIVPGSGFTQTLHGVAAILLCGLALGAVNAGLVRGIKIPSIIATLATLSILDGISLTMRPAPSGTIDPEFTSLLRTGIGPVPMAFILFQPDLGTTLVFVAVGMGMLLVGGVRAIAGHSRVGVLCPLASQEQMTHEKWAPVVGPVEVASASPYGDRAAVAEAGAKFAGGEAEFVVLDCIGFDEDHRRSVREACGRPVLLARSLVGRLAGEVVA